MVRPESLEVTPPDVTRSGAVLRGRVIGLSFMGNHTRITLETAAGAIVVHRAYQSGAIDEDRSPGIGEEACVWWAPDQSTILASRSGGENG
jgi:ABC-type Fe3+/spermidine/putrescine transport system ATPase subunit